MHIELKYALNKSDMNCELYVYTYYQKPTYHINLIISIK